MSPSATASSTFLNNVKLEGHFYRTRQLELTPEGVFRAVVTLAHEHPIFEGHFPQQPVVPGVCTLTIVKECIGKAMQREVLFETIKECKYLSALLPFEGLSIVLDFVLTDSRQLKGTVTRQDNGQTILKLKATLTA